MLTHDQALELLKAAKQRKPDLTKDEAVRLLQVANSKTEPTTQRPNILDMIGLGNMAKTGNILTLGNILKKSLPEANKSISDRFNQSRELINEAKQLPIDQRKPLLDKSRMIMSGVDRIGGAVGELSNRLQSEVGNNFSPVRQGAATAAEAGSWMVPGGEGLTGAIKTGSIVGGLRGVTKATNENNVLQMLKDIGAGSAEGAVTAGATQLVFNGANSIFNTIGRATGKVRQKAIDLYTSTLKENISDVKFYKQFGGLTRLVKKALRYKIPATRNAVRKELRRYGPEFDDLIMREAKQAEKSGKTIDIASAYQRAIKRIEKQFGYDDTLKEQALSWFKKNGYKYLKQTEAKPLSANRLRINLDKKVGDVLTADAVGADAARKAFATELRSEFKNVVSRKGRDAIERYHLLSGLADAMQKEPKFSLPGMVGAMASTMLTRNPLGAIFGGVATKAVRSPGLKRKMAISMMKPIKRGGLQVTAPVINPMVSALQRYIDNMNQQNQTRGRLPTNTILP